jgi:tripartite-type tricarboxylate transporter receptor subunit TctC
MAFLSGGRNAARLCAVLFCVAWGLSAQAQSSEDFYRGKTIRLIIGYGPGGGYDLYGRVAAEFLGQFIPGNPVIVPQNMPGAGSSVAAKYMQDVAPRDGTALGSLVQSLALDTVTGSATGFDVTRFNYIGRLTTNIDVGIARVGAPIKSFEDARTRELTVGLTGGSSPAVLLPIALATYGGAKFKMVRGYQGIADILLAVERGEVEVAGAGGLAGLMVSHPTWITKHEAPILYQAALKRHALLPDVPTIVELALDDEGRQVMSALASTAEIGRSIIVTPGIPTERLALLRASFQKMIVDRGFLATAEKRNVMIDPDTGEAMDAIARDTLRMPKPIIDKVAALLKM